MKAFSGIPSAMEMVGLGSVLDSIDKGIISMKNSGKKYYQDHGVSNSGDLFVSEGMHDAYLYASSFGETKSNSSEWSCEYVIPKIAKDAFCANNKSIDNSTNAEKSYLIKGMDNALQDFAPSTVLLGTLAISALVFPFAGPIGVSLKVVTLIHNYPIACMGGAFIAKNIIEHGVAGSIKELVEFKDASIDTLVQHRSPIEKSNVASSGTSELHNNEDTSTHTTVETPKEDL
ncbi:MAG: hypothetical protein ACI8ZF_000813 [Candidatus Midichloriaceae bacterium]|jgi:hypothetical protein